MNDTPAWRVYERVAACFEMDAAGMDVTVIPNASLVGVISGIKRQIDILVDARWEEGLSRRIIYDAKLRKRKLDVTDVEAFEGLMRDVGATRGVLVCAAGWSQAAEARAEELIDIRLLPVEELDEFEHAAMESCPNCNHIKKSLRGMVFWDGQFPLPLTGWAIIFTGKCDVCRYFAFWCWDCGEKKVVPDDVIHECGCGRTWFVGCNADEKVFVVRTEDGEVPIDRYPLR
ncbi:MAG: restriction endonuclease [Sneathiella sp.]|nr:restriction endonuclease [Sneathiella sp.]